jgi:hypothetical protein
MSEAICAAPHESVCGRNGDVGREAADFLGNGSELVLGIQVV